MPCGKGRYVVRYGEHVEIRSEEGNLLTSFRVPKDMCKEMFDTYLAVRHDVTGSYKIRKLK